MCCKLLRYVTKFKNSKLASILYENPGLKIFGSSKIQHFKIVINNFIAI